MIRADPSLSAQVLHLCNSALFGLRHRVISIEQAAILLGTERLRALVLTCSVMQFAGKRLPKAQLSTFWHHSFLCALLSERLAGDLHYCEKEQAYLGGLLHDIGQLPMWILVIGEDAAHRPGPPLAWTDNIVLEREYFGMDHCKVGRWMGVSWNYMPFIDVFEFHHAPQRAQHDPYLVGIISAADQFLVAQAKAAAAQRIAQAPVKNPPPQKLLRVPESTRSLARPNTLANLKTRISSPFRSKRCLRSFLCACLNWPNPSIVSSWSCSKRNICTSHPSSSWAWPSPLPSPPRAARNHHPSKTVLVRRY